ncbi:hypothetical protein [Flavobacterium sp. LAR06]|uniref:hypothetical protein n=1 Tax=Flavobacterium sp. LAR06 TaxID=3064897 RepID=UPI0035C0A379
MTNLTQDVTLSVALFANDTTISSVYTPTMAGTYTLRATSGTLESNSVVVTVNAMPATSLTLTANHTTVVLGQSITLNAMNNLAQDVTPTATFFADNIAITGGAVYTPTAVGTYTLHATNESLKSNTVMITVIFDPSTNGTANVSNYVPVTVPICPALKAGDNGSGVTQTLTATVNKTGTYNISATANGVIFSSSGTFTNTGSQPVVLTATGTVSNSGDHIFSLNVTPGGVFSIYYMKDDELCFNGKIWKDKNVGATRVATAGNDTEAYGTYMTVSERSSACPSGFRIPTSSEILVFPNVNAAYFSPLRLPLTGSTYDCPTGTCVLNDPKHFITFVYRKDEFTDLLSVLGFDFYPNAAEEPADKVRVPVRCIKN